MVTVHVTEEVRNVFSEALAIGQARLKETTRHRNANEKLMVRAALNVYEAHIVEAVKPDGYAPNSTGAKGKAEVQEAAERGVPLTAKGFALLIGYSESYISRLYRLGHGITAGVLDPHEKPEPGNGPTLWQLVSRTVGDTPEVAAVLGKDVTEEPSIDALQDAVEMALKRKAAEREEAAAVAAEEEEAWIPHAPSEQIGMLEELAEVIHDGRTLTPRQIERVRKVMDELREVVESWVSTHSETAA